MFLIIAVLSNIDTELPVPESVCGIVFMKNKAQPSMPGDYKSVLLHITTWNTFDDYMTQIAQCVLDCSVAH